jgi:hypothetical protein
MAVGVVCILLCAMRPRGLGADEVDADLYAAVFASASE